MLPHSETRSSWNSGSISHHRSQEDTKKRYFQPPSRDNQFRLHDTQKTPRLCFSSKLIWQLQCIYFLGSFLPWRESDFPSLNNEISRELQAPAEGSWYLHLSLDSTSKDHTLEAICQDLCTPPNRKFSELLCQTSTLFHSSLPRV